MKNNNFLKHLFEFIGIYILSMFLVLFAHGYAPKDKERFYASSMIIALVIAGAHEAGRASKK